MAMGVPNKQNHDERLNDVKLYIREHINEPLNRDLRLLLDLPHFHRIFTSHMGENIADYVRRLRSEKRVLAK